MPDASIDTLQIQIGAEASTATSAIDRLVSKLNLLSSSMGRINGSNFKTLSSSAKTASNSINKLNYNRLTKGMNSYTSSTKKASSATNKFASSLGKMYASYWLVFRALQQLGKAITSSMNYIEILNYFNNAWNQVAENADLSAFEELGYESAEAYINSFSERAKQVTTELTGFSIMSDGSLLESGQVSLGINPTQVMNYQAMFGQMASSIGITAENSLLLSEALTKIGADLASVKNMEFEEVWRNMASGLAGMSRTLDKYGVNIRNVNLQQKLWDLGINENIANLNQNDKALLRTIILLESTGYAYGDLAETINAPANQLRLLRANFSNLARTIGNLFLPVIQTVLPYINGLVIALQRLFTWIGSLLGLDFSDLTSSVSSVGGADFSDLIGDTDDLEDSLDKASKSAKKLKDYTLGIDELNIIKPQEESGGVGGLPGGAGGLLNDAFLDAVNKYLEEWDKAFAKVENRANEIADKIQEFALKVWKFIQPFIEALMRFWTAFQKVIDFVITAFEDFYENFLKPLLEWAFGTEDKGLTAFVNTLTDLVNKIDWDGLNKALKDLWIALEPFVEKIGDGLNWFFRNVLSPLAVFLANKVLITAIEALTDALELLTDVIDILTPIAKEFWEEFGKQEYSDILDKISQSVDSLLSPFSSLKDLIDEFSWDNFLKYAKDVADFALLLSNPMGWFATRKKSNESQEGEQSSKGNLFGGAGSDRGYSGSFSESLETLKDNFNLFFDDIGKSATEFFDDLYAKKLQEFVTNTSTKFSEWYENSIKPWFTEEKWDELWNTLMTSAETKWNELVEWWNDTALVTWWEDDVKPWFDADTWYDLYSPIYDELETVWGELVDWWTTSGIYRWYNDNVKPWFDKENWNFSGIRDGLKQAWDSAVETIKGIWNKFAQWLNEKLTINLDTSTLIGKGISDLIGSSKIKLGEIPMYFNGGFPKSASLFWSGENGVPEMVGTIGGSTAVASGAEITGIRDAVYDTGQAEIELLREQNELLRLLLAKDPRIVFDTREGLSALREQEQRQGYNMSGTVMFAK